MNTPILDIRDLHLSFKGHTHKTDILHGISFHIDKGEKVALVGESGSGKSVTARIVLGLLQEIRQSHISGKIWFEGQDLNDYSVFARHSLRGTRMSMIFQDPTSSLNPVYTILEQFREVLQRTRGKLSVQDARGQARVMLEDVSIGDPDRVLDSYAFQLSGGMNQRVMIAMSLSSDPSLLIADEPGTALDVTVQAQTLRLMHDLVEQRETSVLFISHNLGVVREFADRVYVIFKGRIVERGRTKQLFANPGHPYTQALMRAVPRITGGGIAEIEETSEAFFAPLFDHEAGASI